MFRFLIPRQYGNIITAHSVLSQVFIGCNSPEPLKIAAGAWNSRRFVKTEKGLPGGTIREMGGSFGKMAARNEEEYFYKKTKTELEELKKRIRDEPITPPVKRKLEQEALNLDLQLKRMDLRAIIERAEEDRLKMLESKELGKQLEPLQKDSDPTHVKPKIQQVPEFEPKQTSLNKALEINHPDSKIKKSVRNEMHYASDGRTPLQHPPNHPIDKSQQALEMQQLQNRPGTQPEQPKPLNSLDQKPHMIENQQLLRKPGMTPEQQVDDASPSLNKKLLERQSGLKTIKTDFKRIKDNNDVVNKLQQAPKPKRALQKVLKKEIDLTRIGRNKKGAGRRLRRKSALQRAIEKAEKAFKDTTKKK